MPWDSFGTDELQVQVFGGPRVFVRDQPLPLSPQQLAIVGLLYGTQEGILTRSQTISFIWPEVPEGKARRRLNQLLYSLRGRVEDGALFLTQEEEILRPPSSVSFDLEDFDAAMEKDLLLTSLSLLDLGFCPRLLSKSPRFIIDWVESREAELRGRIRRLAERNWLLGDSRENWEVAREAAETLLRLSPSNEETLRRVMVARFKAGAKKEAEAALTDFSSRRHALGESWRPSQETEALLREIRSSPSFPRGISGSRSGIRSPEAPLLGREKERSRLRGALREAPEDALRITLLTGEAGIGKTRLIKEALHDLSLDGHQLFSAGAAELEQMIPLNPLIEALKPPQVGATLQELAEPWRAVLYGVMPAHFPGEGPIPEAPSIQPGSVPRRLFEAFYQLLLSLVEGGPVVLVLEDLHWADETTLSVLEFLFRRWDRGRFQILASIRTEEVRRHRVLSRFLENARVHPEFSEIHLMELDVSASDALIQHLSSRELRASEKAYLRSLSGGNPFFLIELTLEFLEGRLDPTVEPRELIPIPLSIRQVLHRRLTELSEDAHRSIGALAVYSKSLETVSLARIAHLSGARCLAGLDQLHRFRLVTSQGAEVRVSHELIRHTVYQSLTDSRRAWLHKRVAQHILRTRPKPPPDELALHFHLADVGSEARAYANDAAARAEAAGAIPEALRFLRIARERSSEPREIAELIWKMGHLNYLHQNLEEAAPLLELAAQRLQRYGEEQKALRAEVERIDSLAQRGLLPLTECLEELQRVKGEASRQDLWEIHHEVLEVEAHQLYRQGDLAGVRKVLGQAKRHKRKGSVKAQCQASAILALNIYFGSAPAGLDAARESVALASRISDAECLLRALNRLILVLHYLGQLHSSEGQEALSEARLHLGTCGDLNLKSFVHLNRAVWHLEIGEPEKARVALQEVERVLHGTQARDARTMLFINQGELGLVLEEIPTARKSYEQAKALLEPSSPRYFETLIDAGIGMCALHVGELAEARVRESDIPPLPDFWTFDPSIVATFKARMLMKRRDMGGAEHLLNTVRKNIEDRFVPAWLRLTLEQCRMLRRERRSEMRALARDGLVLAEKLQLDQRSRQFSRLLGD